MVSFHPLFSGSTLQDGFELPSRLAVSAADCFIVLTESLSKKAVPSNRQNKSLPSIGCDKNNKSEVTSAEMENLVWDHLEELIHLMQKLLAVSFVFPIYFSFFCLLFFQHLSEIYFFCMFLNYWRMAYFNARCWFIVHQFE